LFVALAENPMPFVLSTNSHLLSAGVASVNKINFNAGPIDGDTMTFGWLDESVVITFKTSPDESGYQVPKWDGVTALAEWLETVLVPALQKNYLLNADFNIGEDYGNDNIIITSRKAGTAYNFTFSETGTTITGKTQVTAGTNNVYNPNFTLVTTVYYATANSYNFKDVELELPPINNVAKFNLQDILENNLGVSPRPVFGAVGIQDITDTLQKYYLVFAEKYGEPPVVQQTQKSLISYTLPGGLTKADAANNEFFVDILPGKKFLSWAGVNRTIFEDELVMLNYFHEAGSGFDVYIVATDASGTVDNDVLFTKAGAANTQLYNIGLTVSNIENALGITPVNFTVKITESGNSANVYSETVSFMVDRWNKPEINYLLFKNSFGVYEVIHFSGKTTNKVANKRKDFTAFIAPDAGVTDRKKVNLQVNLEFKDTINTGFLTKAESLFFSDFLISDDIYVFGDGAFYPVRILAGSAQLFGTDSGTFNGATFTIVRDVNEKHVSYV